MAMTPTVLLLALGTGIGIVGFIYSLVGAQQPRRTKRASTTGSKGGSFDLRRWLLAGVAGLFATIVSRWPVIGIFVGLLVAFGPTLASRTSTSVEIERIEAVATWTELLRDTLAASAGLGEAIVATAAVAPLPVRDPVRRLADRLASGVSMIVAIRAFAAEVDDASCDTVACALLLASSARAQRLADLLGALAESVREEVAMRLRVEASRSSARSSVRTVVVFSLLFAGALVLVAHSYLTPFGTPVGQVVLVGVGGCYAGGIALMLHMVRPRSKSRLLSASATQGPSFVGQGSA